MIGRTRGTSPHASACWILMAFSLVATAWADAATFAIEPQELSGALKAYAAQSHREIFFTPDLVRGKQSRGIKGQLDDLAALGMMLKGTGLTFAVTESNAIMIQDPSQKRDVAPTALLPKGVDSRAGSNEVGGTTHQSTGSNTQLAQATTVPSAGASQGQAQSTSSTERPDIEQIVVLGTYRADLQALESASPVDVVTTQDLAHSPATNIIDSLRELVPSFNAPPSIWESPQQETIVASSLRGLDPGSTLVLIDGRRQNLSPFVSSQVQFGSGSQPADLDVLPSTAIKGLEVLRDGASAQYGSDAIAGVIDISLRDNATGGGFTTRTGGYLENGGFYGDVAGWKGFNLNDKGFVTVAMEYLGRNFANMPGTDNTPDPISYDRTFTLGPAKLEQFKFSVNTAYNLTDEVKAYANAHYSHKDGWGYEGEDYPSSNDNVLSIYPHGTNPLVETAYQDMSATTGLKVGDRTSGLFDGSVGYGISNAAEYTLNSINASLGAASPTNFYDGKLINSQVLTNLDYVRDFLLGSLSAPLTVASGVEYRREKFQVMPGEPASYEYGGVPIQSGESEGELAPPGAQGQPGFTAIDAGSFSRDVYSLYLDLESQITKQWQVGLAGRAEHYSDFGDQYSGKFSTRFDFTDWIALRATVNNGFKAPTVGQIAYSNTTISTNNAGQQELIRTFPVNSPEAKALGATALEPERSVNFSGGLVLRPTPVSSLTIDAYRINLDNRIGKAGSFGGSYVTNVLDNAGYFGYGAASYFANVLNQVNKGLDSKANYRFDLDSLGALTLSAAFNVNHIVVSNLRPTPPVLVNKINEFLNPQIIDIYESGQPNHKLALSADYKIDAWDFFADTTMYGTYTYVLPGLINQTFQTQWVTNIQANYTFAPNTALAGTKLTAGMGNVFDTHPDVWELSTLSTLGAGFSRYTYASRSPAGFMGTSWYVGISHDF
jgi:iron complex outermembrane recepter protein